MKEFNNIWYFKISDILQPGYFLDGGYGPVLALLCLDSLKISCSVTMYC